MSICPPRPDAHRRCFSPCPPGVYCKCGGRVIGEFLGIELVADETMPPGHFRIVEESLPPIKAAPHSKP